MRKCIVMFSGGLDSVVAAHLLKQQGLAVTALHFVLPFASGLGFSHNMVRECAEVLSVPLRIEEEGEEYVNMINNPDFGYGKHVNPCIDCRIHRLQKTLTIMHDTGVSFIATGEVIGQRPMSQRRDSMALIEKRAGLKGLLLRPLSAQLLEPTIPEAKGWVDKNKLLAIKGRGRKEQIEYAKMYGLKHGSPGGGCLLTEKEIVSRFKDLQMHNGRIGLNDFKLLAYGRHFRISSESRLIVGRKEVENTIIEQLFKDNDIRFEMNKITGPLGLGRGAFTEDDICKAASILARYSRVRGKSSTSVKVIRNNVKSMITITPATEDFCNEYLV